MNYNKKLLSISMIMLCAIVLWAQPMAEKDDAIPHLFGDVLTSPEVTEAALESRTEDFLYSLIWDVDNTTPTDHHQSHYGHIVELLQDLEDEKGNDPFFFDAYYHPLAQQMSGFTFGYAGAPIAQFDTSMNGKVTISLTTETPKAAIHYTVDGTTPDETSPVWRDPLCCDHKTLIKAKTIRSDLEHSPMLQLSAGRIDLEPSGELLDEDKIMGVFAIPGSQDVMVKYKTKAQGFITISLIDDQRQSYYIDEILAMVAQFGTCRINTSDIADGAYLIKLRFDSGKIMYRQMMKE